MQMPISAGYNMRSIHHPKGLAYCRYVAHQSDIQCQNAPKGYIAPQGITREIIHIHVDK